jgi:hypothetical protein
MYADYYGDDYEDDYCEDDVLELQEETFRSAFIRVPA